MVAAQFPITVEVPSRWRRLSAYWIEERVNEEMTAREPEIIGGGDPGDERSSYWVDFDLPLEVIPVLSKVDLESTDSILMFVQEFGTLGVRRESLGHGGYRPSVWSSEDWIDGALPEPWGSLLGPGESEMGTAREWVHDFRAGAATVLAGAAVEHELSYHDRFSPMRLNKAWPLHAPWDPPTTVRSARFFLSRLMDFGLAHQRLVSTPNLEGKGEFGVMSSPYDSLFGRMLLEIVQAQTENLPYRRCAKCHVLFSKQSGGSRFHSRVDAIYCSPLCARAAAQAAFRKRHRNGVK